MKKVVDDLIALIKDKQDISLKTKKIFENCIKNTFTKTIKETKRDDYFVITGDIPAMWLRDSSGQIKPLFYIDTEESNEIIYKVLKRQLFCLSKDIYANAFNEEDNNNSWDNNDITDKNPYIWERKYELDSICYPLDTLCMYYEKTKDLKLFDLSFFKLLNEILDILIIEQNHLEKSKYYFKRPNPYVYYDTLSGDGYGSPVKYTGLTWSGFRPSDDACTYQYLIPSNIFLIKVLQKLIKVFKKEFSNENLIIDKMKNLKKDIELGIEKYGVVVEENKKIYAYEVDGLGNYLLMDDANVPSLLSLPYLECDISSEIYENTRSYILSNKNKYYYEGELASGIGSPHTPKDYIWPISLSIQSMTEKDKNKQKELLEILTKTDGNKYLMHESFHKDDDNNYTRDWFSWSNSLFCEAVLVYLGYTRIIKEEL